MALPTRVSREQQQQQHVPMIHPIELMHREFDDLLSRFFGGGGEVFGPSTTGALPAGMLAAALGSGYAVDVREDDKHVYIDADLPGFRKEDVDISIEGKTLTISAEHKEEIREPAQQPQMTQQQGQQPAQQAGQPAQQPATRRAAVQEQKGQYLLRERRFERFTRSFSLPEDVDTQNVQAKLENGVLEVTLSKTQQSKRTKVKVS